MTLWEVYERHVMQVDRITAKMSAAGMPIDHERRMASAKELDRLLREAEEEAEFVVPRSLRSHEPPDGFVREPKDTTGLIRITVEATVSRCSLCGLQNPTKPHFKSYKRPTEARPQNPCAGGVAVENVEMVERYARLKPLKLSPKLLLAYMDLMGHPKVFHGKGVDRKPTTDENALRTIMIKHPDDPVYSVTLKQRKLKKLAGTYIGYLDPESPNGLRGGLVVGSDGRIHPAFTHSPSTLRFASENPNAQNLPRPDDILNAMVRGMFVAGEGKEFGARDFSGIEAVLIGYEARSKDYTRLSLLDVHTYTTMMWLYEQGQVKYSELPQLAWSDADLKAALAEGKKRFKRERGGIKHNVHAGNFGASAKKTQEMLFDMLGWVVPIAEVRKFKQFYQELFPEIHNWHWSLARDVDECGYTRNNYGYLHRFYGVLKWENVHGEWSPKLGDTCKELFAFKPQSTAAAIMKESMLDFAAEYPHLVEYLRLTIHDELLAEYPRELRDEILEALRVVMERPRRELPLPAEWGMGEYLAINTEGKVGNVWSEMREVT